MDLFAQNIELEVQKKQVSFPFVKTGVTACLYTYPLYISTGEGQGGSTVALYTITLTRGYLSLDPFIRNFIWHQHNYLSE